MLSLSILQNKSFHKTKISGSYRKIAMNITGNPNVGKRVKMEIFHVQRPSLFRLGRAIEIRK